ncbi:4Fe-4S dicluster domain-containing protein [Streptomyces sp. ISL-22]|uniref:nitrate reductase subunit beta n=1 Tax=unclassified Streptomyces TaxID=2593676 RepID=UPI001BEC4280|nr:MULTISPECIES: 4Fe-4S dicluster domain-containing protein [unclassified Streptomyces]MBT2416654.1 4Fe-4S dicluster domain-containing protein [Streptomyces sp. ISL-24]MBT2437316.1 4Fe-4S dicluster domain-containing protein [Streptomyces sp. ISL-22]
MRPMAQIAMVMNLDKCIGCHTCSVSCKEAWTDRQGMEHVWFNHVETRPGQGYPRRYEDQERWRGGWRLNRRGALKPTAGGRLRKLAGIFSPPELPATEDYEEPWTYGHKNRAGAPAHGDLDPVAERARRQASDKVRNEFEQAFMFYLPRICEHCLNPSCVASCPSGAMYKRAEDGVVLVDQDRCRGWRMCVTGCPYKKVYFNDRTGKAEKCTLCAPRIEAGLPTVCSETCVGRLRYLGVVLYDADKVTAAASVPREQDLYEAQLDVFLDPEDTRVRRACEAAGIPDDWLAAARRSPVHALISKYRVALPLHPEYRTMPMVWYIPPLSPVVEALTETGHDGEDARNLFGAIDALRIPLEYLAEMFTAGDVGPVRSALERLAAMRSHMRAVNLGEDPDPSVSAAVGMGVYEIEEMYRLLAVAEYADRYVIPTAAVGDARRLEESALTQGCSLDYEGGPGSGGDGPFGRGSGRKLLPLTPVEKFHILGERRTADHTADVEET